MWAENGPNILLTLCTLDNPALLINAVYAWKSCTSVCPTERFTDISKFSWNFVCYQDLFRVNIVNILWMHIWCVCWFQFDPLLVESRQAGTCVLMLDSAEEDVVIKAAEAIYKFVEKCKLSLATFVDKICKFSFFRSSCLSQCTRLTDRRTAFFSLVRPAFNAAR